MSERVIEAAKVLRDAADALEFSPPTDYVYNPLVYAWAAHRGYLRKHGSGRKRVVLVGMNPGPFGMAQTGVPFGEISLVRDWVGIEEPVLKPGREHPKRRIEGFECTRSEVSGRRLWGLFRDRFGTAEAFFKEHFVTNYCPLVFMESSGRNRTPDKLPPAEAKALHEICNAHLRALVEAMEPEWLIAVGGFAEKRAREALDGSDIRIGRVLHPSPASPAANRGWAEQAVRQLEELGVW